jgi:hypothetical protein
VRRDVHHCHDDACADDGGDVDHNKPRNDCTDGYWRRSVHEDFDHGPIPGEGNCVGRSRRAGGEGSRA